ncbi:MAG: hypothetical protein QNJ72_16015 [Pleurocapsa sp. MO_226.B13]|nr:hypothetical protein [Pleurocapsa sp. MO_226.B13]
MKFNTKENLKRVNDSLQKRVYNLLEVQDKYSEPVPNNYSFIFFHGKQEFLLKNQLGELYKPLNCLIVRVYDYYSHLNINNFNPEALKTIKSILYHWNNLIEQGRYFLTWKLFIKLDEIINESQIIKKNKQKYFVELSNSLPEELLNEWEIGLAISQDELEYALSLIVAKLTEYPIEPKRIEVSKIFTNSNPHPSFPTIKLHFHSCCFKKELSQLCFDIINVIKENNLRTGNITQGFGENYADFLRIQNGFEGLKRILNQMKTIDNFYCPKYDYAYRKIGMEDINHEIPTC